MSTDSTYVANKAKLCEALKQHGEKCILNRSEAGVGLWNQGATCYLNSIIQSLCWDENFRQALFSQKQCDDGTVTKEMQRLFAQLQLSLQAGLSTKNLTSAFGWNKSQSHEQHDVHELFSLLLDSLVDTNTKELFDAKMKGRLGFFVI